MKLTLQEIIQLFDELNGRLINSQTGERTKGLLSNKLSIKIKYILVNELNKKITEYVKEFEECKIEVFKELGNLENGNYVVPDEKIDELNKQLLGILSIEKDVDVPNISLDDLSEIETEYYFPILLDKLLTKK